MKKYRYFLRFFKGLGRLLLFAPVVAAYPHQSMAVTLDVRVADGEGGRVASVPGDMDCMPHCVIQAFPQTVVSLFALADKAYRFKGWEGACKNTIGPLCTLTAEENASVVAHFAKAKARAAPAKVLLLLHGKGFRHTVWNEFAKQHFNNLCPVVYGGVVLGKDSFDPDNKVYCYRVAFGYYDMLVQGAEARGLQVTETGGNTLDDIAAGNLAHEVRAAVLGVLSRHPNISLTVVSQSSASLAALGWLGTDAAEHSDAVGLLALYDGDNTGLEPLQQGVLPIGTAGLVTLQANPEQVGKISAGLAQLTQMWWTER
ncbi:MAG: hypothetical protein PHR16_10260 [Methylovulum sp.]|nr:hypothetical protein [Methylovulum sp.]